MTVTRLDGVVLTGLKFDVASPTGLWIGGSSWRGRDYAFFNKDAFFCKENNNLPTFAVVDMDEEAAQEIQLAMMR